MVFTFPSVRMKDNRLDSKCLGQYSQLPVREEIRNHSSNRSGRELQLKCMKHSVVKGPQIKNNKN